MIDTTTYGLTKDLPGGPIYRPAEPMPHELFGGHERDDIAMPLTLGKMVGGVISAALLLGAGTYLFLAI